MRANEYRARATDLRLEASRVKDAKVRKQFLLMALDWERLAENVVAWWMPAAPESANRRAD